jgi:mono/diheme cytochrome c family protein
MHAHAGGGAVCLLAALVLLAGSAQGGGARADPALASMGEPYFAAYCASCHGPSGEGDGRAAPKLDPAPADLTRIAARRGGSFPDGEVAKYLDGRFDAPQSGARDMPIWGQRFSESVPEAGVGESLARGKIAVLVEYLKAIQTNGPAVSADE